MSKTKKINYAKYLKKFDKAKGTSGGMIKKWQTTYSKKNSRGQRIEMTPGDAQRYPGLVDKYWNKK